MGNRRFLLVILLGIAALAAPVYGARSAALFSQSPLLTQYEAQVVYYSNLERANRGIAPLRWNRELTNSARWFAWDSVVNRPLGFCGHQDSTGGWPTDRNLDAGYYGLSGAENAFCGFLLPLDAVAGWMASEGHRNNILDPNSREIGVGYYRRDSDGRGYVVQDFGQDPLYPPVVINNEALNTTSSQVNLYVYSSGSGGGFNEAGPAKQMRLSNTPCMEDAAWQTYDPTISWTLAPGDGWRTVYVQTRDAFGRYFTVTDTIYRGATVPIDQLGDAQMSQTLHSVNLYNQPPAGTTAMQYSLGWAADDSYPSFTHWWGNGQEDVADTQAWGGTSFRMSSGAGETFAWIYTTDFYTNVPMVAYFRLKVADNTSTSGVARIEVQGGSSARNTLNLNGTDFKTAGVYQEFAIPFTFIPSAEHPFLFFNIARTGQPDVYFDAVTIFSASKAVPTTNPFTLTFNSPFRYRGQTLWLRWLDASGKYSQKIEGQLIPPNLAVSPASVGFLSDQEQLYPFKAGLTITQLCGSETVAVSGAPSWLQVSIQSGTAILTPSDNGLSVGQYDATLTFSIPSRPQTPVVQVQVRLLVTPQVFQVFTPVIHR